MNKQELVAEVAEICGLSETAVNEVLRTASLVVADVLSDPDNGGESVQVPGFGRFSAELVAPFAVWKARPAGGLERVSMPGSKGVRFKPAKRLRGIVAGQDLRSCRP